LYKFLTMKSLSICLDDDDDNNDVVCDDGQILMSVLQLRTSALNDVPTLSAATSVHALPTTHSYPTDSALHRRQVRVILLSLTLDPHVYLFTAGC